jgi:hypothetical protein
MALTGINFLRIFATVLAAPRTHYRYAEHSAVGANQTRNPVDVRTRHVSRPRIASPKMLLNKIPAGNWGGDTESGRCRRWREESACDHGARWCRRWPSATGRRSDRPKGDELCATTGWHRKHAVRTLRQLETVPEGDVGAPRKRRRRYGATIKDALTALWEASDRVCGKRLKVMSPILLPALERNDRLKLGRADRDHVLAISAASVDRLLGDVKVAASGGKR